MSQVEQLQNEISALSSGNPIYTDMYSTWEYLLESYMGGQSYKDGQHLTKYQLENASEYAARLNQTYLDNHCKSVVSVYNSFLFRQNPIRDLGNLESLPETQAFLKDADFDGRSLNQFMKDVATYSSIFGHTWIILVKPSVGATTRADEQLSGARPYANLITPLSMLDWNWHRQPNGAYVLDYIRYIEDINGNTRTIKEWTMDTVTTYTVVTDTITHKQELVNRVDEPNQLGKIPAICAYNAKGPVRGIGISDLQDIAGAQKMIFNLTSELEETIRLDSHPSIVATPDTILGNGAGSVVQMPGDLDPGLRPYLLQYNGASVKSILDSIDNIINSIDKMANTGAVRATESKTLSGVAMETEFQLLNARLSEKGDNMELCEEQLWKCFAEYYGREFDGEIDYPDSFNIKDTHNEFSQLETAGKTANDPRIKRLIDERIVELLDEDVQSVLPEIAFEPHIMYDAEGNAFLARTEADHLDMQSKGYTHDKPTQTVGN